MRASLIAGGLENKTNRTDADTEFLTNRFSKGYMFTQGSEIDAYTQNLPEGVSEADLMRRGDAGSAWDVLAPGMIDALAGSPAETKFQALSKFNQGLADKYNVKPEDSGKLVTAMQVGLGGAETPEQQDVIDKMFGITQDTGKDQLGLYSQYASMRGVEAGTDEWQSGAAEWVGAGSEEERMATLKRQTKMSQAYSQFTPYLEGGVHTAAQLADQFGLGQMASAQAFAQVATGFGLDTGRDMTDQEATTFAGMMGNNSPRVNMKLAGIATSMAGIGAGNMTDVFSSLSGAVGNGVDANFLSEAFSGNLYGVSDVGQLLGQGNLQYYQQDGLRMGTTDISGVVLGAQQRLGLDKSSTTQQTLGAMGLSFGSAEAQDALTSGGLEGYEKFYANQRWDMQQRQFGMQQSQIGSNESNMYATWAIQDQITATQFSGQMDQYAYSFERMDTQQQFSRENQAAQKERWQSNTDFNRWQQDFSQGTATMQRGFTRENWDFQSQSQAMNFGWSMEDFDEAICRASGYERAQLIKQRDRSTLSYNMNTSNTERTRDNQEDLWKREDERFEKTKEHTEEMTQLDEVDFERHKSQSEQLYQMERENTVRRQEETVKLHELQLQLQAEQRAHQEEQLAFSKQSLELQIEMARQQHEYSENTREFTQSREKDEATMRKLIGYAPAFSRMAADWIKMIDTLDRKSSSLSNLTNVFNVTR